MTVPAETLMRAARRLNRNAPRLPAMIALSDERRAPDPAAMLATLPPGSAFIFRDYTRPAGEREMLARGLRQAAKRRGILFLVAGDVPLAIRLQADGVHLPEWQLSRLTGRLARTHPFTFITAAAHSPAALWRAARAGADAALLSPVFATASHPRARPLGLVKAAEWAGQTPLPVYALGGINGTNAPRLTGTRFCGLAGIGFAKDRAR